MTLKQAVLKQNDLYFLGIVNNQIEWGYRKEDAKVLEGEKQIREQITLVADKQAENNEVNVHVEYLEDHQEEEPLLTGDLHGSSILK